MLLDRFSYIIQSAFAGNLEVDVKNLLEINGKPKTFTHVVNVAAACARIGEGYGLDGGLCRISGLLYDVSAVIRPEDMLEYAYSAGPELCEAEKRHPFLLHQKCSPPSIATPR